jgi:hypothetical protein
MGHPWAALRSGGRTEAPMKTQQKWRNPLRNPHHAAELAALVVALAAGLSVDAIACRLMQNLDDDPLPL